MASGGELAGEEAMRRGAWAEAAAAFREAVETAPTPRALDGLGRASWWLGDVDAAVTHRGHAFDAYRRVDDDAAAARIAFWLSREFRLVVGNPAAANGWFARGDELVEALPDGAAHGWRHLARSDRSMDPAARERHAEEALAVARRWHDGDLEVYALAARGLARVTSGWIDRGITDLDAAVASAIQAAEPETVGDVLCSLMAAVELVGDASRFAQWNDVLEQYMLSQPHVRLTGFCFTCCGEVFVVNGRWKDAEQQFVAAIDMLEQTGHRSRCAHPVTRLAHLRIRQGRLEEAEALLEEFVDLPEAVEPTAALRLAQGQPTGAIRVLERRLAAIGTDTLLAVPLLTLLGDAQLAAGDLVGAAATAELLAAMADRSDLARVRGLQTLLQGRIAARGDEGTALRLLDTALGAFQEAAMPLEVAATHWALARLAADAGDIDTATEEGRVALGRFRELGATRSSDEVAAFLRELGVRVQSGPRAEGLLTHREQEVLDLVIAGMTNTEIAARLFISPKTAGNHVSNVLAKLGVRSRTEAAARVLKQRGT